MLIAFLPCFNENETIGEIIDKTMPFVDKVIVVDDGSWDGSGQIAKDHGATVLTHLLNVGCGAAFKTAILYIREKYPNSELITLDSDGQHFPEDIPLFLESPGDVVVGARLEVMEGLSTYKKYLNKIASKMTALLAGCDISDSESGFRYYSPRALEELDFNNLGYGWASESIINLSKKGFAIEYVPIKTVWGIPSRAGQSTRGLRYGIKTLLKLLDVV